MKTGNLKAVDESAKAPVLRRASGDHPVARLLRQEVGFACPVCGYPILVYHHFDPSWVVEQHNRPEGMIALCRKCHDDAEGGMWTKDQLTDLKRNPIRKEKQTKNLLSLEPGCEPLYRLGGSYMFGGIAIEGRNLLWTEQTRNGVMLFSFDLLDSKDRLLLQVRQNSLDIEALNVWDLQLHVDGSRVVARQREGSVALDLKIEYLERKELEQKFVADNVSSEGLISEITKRLNTDNKACLIDLRNATLNFRGNSIFIKNGISIIKGPYIGEISLSGFVAVSTSGMPSILIEELGADADCRSGRPPSNIRVSRSLGMGLDEMPSRR